MKEKEAMNAIERQRFERINAIVEQYAAEVSGDRESAPTDIITDLMHWFSAKGQDFDLALDVAGLTYQDERMMYEEETA